jgi:hypothetical protein
MNFKGLVRMAAACLLAAASFAQDAPAFDPGRDLEGF